MLFIFLYYKKISKRFIRSSLARILILPIKCFLFSENRNVTEFIFYIQLFTYTTKMKHKYVIRNYVFRRTLSLLFIVDNYIQCIDPIIIRHEFKRFLSMCFVELIMNIIMYNFFFYDRYTKKIKMIIHNK